MGKKNSKPDIREVDESTWKELQARTLYGIRSILKLSTSLLIDLPTSIAPYQHTAITAGLYTYAIEEYGKLLILQSYTSSNGRVRINIYDEFKNHDPKFEKVSEVLPKECLLLNSTLNIITSFGVRKSVFFSEIDKNGKLIDVPYIEVKHLKRLFLNFKKS